MKTKKILYSAAVPVFTLGAAFSLGVLSFGGMFALWPILPLAAVMFVLSVGYEGEIYRQNIQGALNKLFIKHAFLERNLAKKFLLQHFPDIEDENCPQFFKDYEQQLHALEQFSHKKLSKQAKKQKKKIKQNLIDMEKWLAVQLFAHYKEDEKLSGYEEQLQTWLNQHGYKKEFETLLKRRRRLFRITLAFSLLAGSFMALSTSYLLVGQIALFPLLALIPGGIIPAVIIPMAIIAGSAYCLLTYNAIYEMIDNETIQKWYNNLREDFHQGFTLRNLLIASTAILLVVLAIALTICTAGTWWTIAKTAQPLFPWMAKMPNLIMGIINPIITGISSLIFNLENTADSLEIAYTSIKNENQGNFFSNQLNALTDSFTRLRQRENWLQIINPFRLLLKVTITPLRIILFLGHLVSIGVTADRLPGVPAILSALLGIISEGFEDAHYFFGEHEHHDHPANTDEIDTQTLLKKRFNHQHGHNHNNDIPTRVLKLVFSPIYFLATLYDYAASRVSSKPLSFSNAWHKQTGHPHKDHGHQENPEVEISTSEEWETERAVYKIERYKQKHFNTLLANRSIGQAKVANLTAFQETLKNREGDQGVANLINSEAQKPIYNQHRLFAKEKAATKAFLEGLGQSLMSN